MPFNSLCTPNSTDSSPAEKAGIIDNRLGFDQKMANGKIFQLYQQFNTSIHGKGLGLLLVKTQVEMLEGKITVNSEENVGTGFSLSIPEASM